MNHEPDIPTSANHDPNIPTAMNHEPDIPPAPKPERTPLADNHRLKKKVRTETDEIMEIAADSDDADSDPSRANDRGGLKRQLFPDSIGDDGGGPSAMDAPGGQIPAARTHTATPLSFKDTLMRGTTTAIPEVDAHDVELTLEEDDFSITMEGLIPSIRFSQRVKNLMAEGMRYAVVVKLLGRFMRQDTLHARIEHLWKPSLGFKLTELEGGCYLVRLHCDADYQKALLGGPWVILGHYLTVHPWTPELSPLHLEIKQVFGWIRLPGLPFHYYHQSVLRTIGEQIGEVLKIDYNTAGGVKARFARIAVKIDLQKPLLSRLKLDGVTQYIEYEGLPTICYNCGCYGHLEGICPLKVPQSQGREEAVHHAPPPANPPPPAGETTMASSREKQLFGEWMKAPTKTWRAAKTQRPEQTESEPGKAKSGNRYDVLASSASANVPSKESQPEHFVGQQPLHPTFTAQKTTNPRPSDRKATTSRTKKTDKPQMPKKKSQASPSPNQDSIFHTQAYQALTQNTTLNPAHHTVISLAGQAQPSKIPSAQIPLKAPVGKENLLPQPPDGRPGTTGFKLQSGVQIKTLRTKAQGKTEGPSEKLQSLIDEALGNPPSSEEDQQFVEATDEEFVDAIAASRSQPEHQS